MIQFACSHAQGSWGTSWTFPIAFSTNRSSACVAQVRNHNDNSYSRIRESGKTSTTVSYSFADMEELNLSIIAIGW